jgi:hypothetical protein
MNFYYPNTVKDSCRAGLQPAPRYYSSVDDNHGKDEVTGSSPVGGSIFYADFSALFAF